MYTAYTNSPQPIGIPPAPINTGQINNAPLTPHTSRIPPSPLNNKVIPANSWQAYQPGLIPATVKSPPKSITKANGQTIYPQLMAALQRLPGADTMPPELVGALATMVDIKPFPGMDAYAKSMGIDVIWKNGQDALNHILANNINVVFGDMGESTAHAQWITDQNTIMINQKYRGDASPTMLYALSEAIFHEAGHAARSGDGQSSIQEETNCLFLNAWANYQHQMEDPAYANSTSQSELLSNGVALYTKLFFQDPDPEKNALVRRIALKYGVLPIYSHDHGPQRAEKVFVPNNLNPGWWMGLPSIASRVVSYVHNENAAKLFGSPA